MTISAFIVVALLLLLTVVFFSEVIWNALVSRLFSMQKTRATYLNLKGWIDPAFGGLLGLLGIKSCHLTSRIPL